MALKLTLSPNEKLVGNGAVIQNGDRRASVVVRNKASILREKDILLPEQAVTPMRRVYFEIMMMYLDEKRQKPHFEAFSARITEFMNAIRDSDAIGACVAIIQLVHDKEYYKALLACRRLYDFEEARLNYVPPELSAGSERH